MEYCGKCTIPVIIITCICSQITSDLKYIGNEYNDYCFILVDKYLIIDLVYVGQQRTAGKNESWFPVYHYEESYQLYTFLSMIMD